MAFHQDLQLSVGCCELSLAQPALSDSEYLLPWWSICLCILSSFSGYLFFTADVVHLQMLSVSVFFPTALSMPPSLAKDPNSLASLPCMSILSALLFQHLIRQVASGSPSWGLKSFSLSHSFSRDKDQMVTSGSDPSTPSGSASEVPFGHSICTSLHCANCFSCVFLAGYRGIWLHLAEASGAPAPVTGVSAALVLLNSFIISKDWHTFQRPSNTNKLCSVSRGHTKLSEASVICPNEKGMM